MIPRDKHSRKHRCTTDIYQLLVQKHNTQQIPKFIHLCNINAELCPPLFRTSMIEVHITFMNVWERGLWVIGWMHGATIYHLRGVANLQIYQQIYHIFL